VHEIDVRGERRSKDRRSEKKRREARSDFQDFELRV
jgi:hypothetical protein